MNCLAALYVTFAYCYVNLEIKVTGMHKSSKWKGVVSINLVLPIICTGVIVDWAGEFSVLGVAPPSVSFLIWGNSCLEDQTAALRKRVVAWAGESCELVLLLSLCFCGAWSRCRGVCPVSCSIPVGSFRPLGHSDAWFCRAWGKCWHPCC